MSSPVLERVARLRAELGVELGGDPGSVSDTVAGAFHRDARRLAATAVGTNGRPARLTIARAWDRALTHPVWGFAVMGALLFVVLWITVAGAAVPSDLLYALLVEQGHGWLAAAAAGTGAPWWLTGVLVDGAYLATAWVIAVMLPPMAIFFPLFTLLEDLGYLPRVAFNLDRLFAGAGAHGKQALSMMMGFGCNAAGVTATRIIDSPRERLIAIITNNFSICNGRWPTLILLGTVFVGALAPAPLAGAVAAATVVGVAVLGVATTLLVSVGLSRTVLRGQTSVYSLELPPYRRPQILRVLWTSVIDRTVKVLQRAVLMAAPAGVVMWLVVTVRVDAGAGAESLGTFLAHSLEPLGWLLGLNGVILLAYVIAIPANEIVVPAILMLTLGLAAGAGPVVRLADVGSLDPGPVLVQAGGWTLLTAVNLMLFSLLHNPCSTTIITIWKETRSLRWTALSTFLPLTLAFGTTMIVAAVVRLAG